MKGSKMKITRKWVGTSILSQPAIPLTYSLYPPFCAGTRVCSPE
jgi:hypothetical protein